MKHRNYTYSNWVNRTKTESYPELVWCLNAIILEEVPGDSIMAKKLRDKILKNVDRITGNLNEFLIITVQNFLKTQITEQG